MLRLQPLIYLLIEFMHIFFLGFAIHFLVRRKCRNLYIGNEGEEGMRRELPYEARLHNRLPSDKGGAL
jgi:hypothetical protein